MMWGQIDDSSEKLTSPILTCAVLKHGLFLVRTSYDKCAVSCAHFI